MIFSEETRVNNLKKMSEKELDILVIGGGITGAGIVLDGVTRGLDMGMVEMRDFGSGTSSRSTKLVHGGLRYLQQFEVKTVAEVGQERAVVYENAPQITTPLKMVLPFYKGGTFGPLTTAIGLDMYDFLARVKRSERKFMLNKEESLKREPLIRAEGLKGTGVYVEYRTDDSRLTLETIKKASELGAHVANYTKVTKLLYSHETGQVIGVRALDLVNKVEYPIYAKRVVNAAGPWVDNIREMDNSKKGKYLHLTKGVHLVFDGKRFPLKNAMYFDTPFKDKRMMFAIPREGKVYVGTTDTFYDKDQREPGVTMEDVTYILNAVNQVFDIEPLTLADIESSWSGVRPLIHEEGKSPSEISRKDEIFHSETGLYSIAGGKLTGYRKMAEEIVDKVLKDLSQNEGYTYVPCATKHLTLSGGDVGGGDGFAEFKARHIELGVSEYGLTAEEADKLVQRYGSNVTAVYNYLDQNQETRLPRIEAAMLQYGLEHEMTIHPIDFLLRRSSYMLFNMARCQEIYQDVINEMASYYDWSEEYQEQMIEETETEIKQHINFT
ncbi:glycerol-3-phosphate dehydrogenase/oxidase [Vagococcus lutrae]|uniref:glycerol-3-phosphate dehydrogenase/oxidase n=1 Tax=Vagococcus lutrae TaxID=81947 RepID=UPI0020978A7E|nr:glycerol-3-phosphate dehydrogenase/oxidase [Vagococcus lutrae]MCO7151845.1 glycerol-3-phosphate dehydrogenase/oxidase [Vagococcus lutrae]MDT2811650.1 glycerol-3-phosphate dehydrogenase/oxidase [Vagococcus lutrae]MDT2819711.1 glycerol-3-phosphate dehydrogenase/oxidase [Vagococcus lutrae]MDT2844523.1 glycerol-3-phosphate dehydrogenase/oxidase [Vagococcus lutrae]WCG04672.1 glycerol-3-phosphate dehydrogenase/oxidase [Vagococcus lutrae]